ncbi:hypothetical protein BaRGS_00001389 [Batillaria attramentaria]|uniref:Alanine racemase C-terminal domain-containing protein n=1 Tax=Batillaria attramentaria TaxID=370345 RepID=A0ABD0M672_9CAEN
MSQCQNVVPPPLEFQVAGRSNYLRIDLDTLTHNVNVLLSKCSPHTELMAVIKANAYGHGAVGVARHLVNQGVRHFAVATAYEGRELRQAGIQGFIQVFGNCVGEEMDIMRQFQLTPTVTTEAFLTHWAAWPSYTLAEQQSRNSNIPQVVIKVDSGMSRNGCQPEELPTLMDLCSELGVPVHSLMTHFAQAWDDPHFTLKQLDTFLSAVQPYRKQGVKLHAANSCGIIRGFGTNLDLVRPGICLYGLPPDPSEETVKTVEEFGLRPALSWIARPNMVKHLKPGRHVGYDQTYRLEKEETIATFALGYADGYSRQLSGKGILTTAEGHEQPVVGRVSMDAITVSVDRDTLLSTPFYVYKDDFSSPNSMASIARALNTIPYEVGTSLAARLPRLYVTGTTIFTADGRVASGLKSKALDCGSTTVAQG